LVPNNSDPISTGMKWVFSNLIGDCIYLKPMC
jgi:hypothetical protein